MRKGLKFSLFVVLFLTALSCRKLYFPEVAATDKSILVVEGVINAGSDLTTIRLSHTVQLSEQTSTQPETGAVVTVEGDGVVYTLSEGAGGTYLSTGLNLDVNKKYHLRIHTLNGQEYLSTDEEVKVTPPIDSLTSRVEDDGLHFYAAAHDPSNKTRYYRWDYDETWRFNSRYLSNYKVVGNEVVRRVLPQDEIFKCFQSYQSSTIVLGTSAKLSGDVLTQVPITQITPESEKISVRYSILLKQYALTKDAYAFWENVKRNTETLGSIFDALPSEISGNIHNTADAKIPVIGYVSISTVSSKRIFVDRSELPFNPKWRTKYPFDGCEELEAKGDDILTNVINASGYNTPTYAITNPRGEIIGYGFSSTKCTDCTIRGTTQKPSFWVE